MLSNAQREEGLQAFEYLLLYVASDATVIDRAGQDFPLTLEYISESTLMELRGMKLVLRDPLTELDLEDAQHVLKTTKDWASEKFIEQEGPKNPLKQIEFAQKVLATYKADRFTDYLRKRGYYTSYDGNDMVAEGLVVYSY